MASDLELVVEDTVIELVDSDVGGTSASAAATSAAAALASKNAAATSATNAATSETNALASKNAASGSATAASGSATAAAGSATAAAGSATAASGSATAANTSKTNAATSETNALASKNAAATSATNAAASETNALASKNAAATSATNAATSETNAAASALQAASSAASLGSGLQNLLVNGSGELGDLNWPTAFCHGQPGNAASGGPYFTNSLTALTGTPQYSYSNLMPIAPGVTLTIQGVISALGLTAGSAIIGIEFRDASNNLTNAVTPSGVNFGTGPTFRTASGAGIAGTTQFRVRMGTTSSPTGPVNSVTFQNIKVAFGSTQSTYSQEANALLLGPNPPSNLSPVFLAVQALGNINAVNNANLFPNGSAELGNTGWGSSNFGARQDSGNGGMKYGNSAIITAGSVVEDVSAMFPLFAGPITMQVEAYVGSGLTGSGIFYLALDTYTAAGALITSNAIKINATNASTKNTFTLLTATATLAGGTIANGKLRMGVDATTGVPAVAAVQMRRIKIEAGSTPSLYSQEADMVYFGANPPANLSPVFQTVQAKGGFVFPDGSTQGVAVGRNRIINGDMRINQYASTYVASMGTHGFGAADRFAATNSGGGGQFTQSLVGVNVAGVQKGFLVQTVNTAVASTTGTNYWGGLSQYIEGLNCYDLLGKPVVASFWFYTNVAGTFSASLFDGTAANACVTTFAAVVGVQKITLSFGTLPTTLGISNNTTLGLGLAIGFLNTGTYQTAALGAWQAGILRTASGATNWGATVGNYIGWTDVQFEEGTVATPFERRSYGQELALCQRYYEVISFPGFFLNGQTTGVTTLYLPIQYSVAKRAPASIVFAATAGAQIWNVGGGNANADTSFVAANQTVNGFKIWAANSTGNSGLGGVQPMTITNSAEL